MNRSSIGPARVQLIGATQSGGIPTAVLLNGSVVKEDSTFVTYSKSDCFLSLDWGTTRMRLRLVRSEPFEVLASESKNEGILKTHQAYRAEDATISKEDFYRAVISRIIFSLEDRIRTSLVGLPIVASGMVSSSIGIRDLPYARPPFAIAGGCFGSIRVPAAPDFPHTIWLLTGLATEKEIMRGEETEICGLLEQGGGDGHYILPGTHSKHVLVRGGAIHSWKTYLTGELFGLLAAHSTLESYLDLSAQIIPASHFLQGVKQSADSPLLHELFGMRARNVLRPEAPEDNTQFLSGLLIGHEVRGLARDAEVGQVYLAAPGAIGELYLAAWRECSDLPLQLLSERKTREAIPRAHARFLLNALQ